MYDTDSSRGQRDAGSGGSPAYQNLSAFRDEERRYKWSRQPHLTSTGKQLKARKNEFTQVDLTDVIDVRQAAVDASANATAEPSTADSPPCRRPSLRRLPCIVSPITAPSLSASPSSSSSRVEAEEGLGCYAVDEIPGLYIFPRVLSEETQKVLCSEAILQYGDSSRYANSLSTHVKAPEATSCYRPPMRWATIGFNYQWSTKTYDKACYSHFPTAVRVVMQQLSAAVFVAEAADEGVAAERKVSRPEIYEPQSGIVNYFPVGTSMMAHQDASEEALTQPLLSLSLGCSCIFLMGSESREDRPRAFLLRSGDAVAFAGPSRLCYHAIPRILDDCPDYLTVPDGEISASEKENYDNNNFVYHWNGVTSGRQGVELVDLSETQRERYWRLALKHMRININVRQAYPESCPFLFTSSA